MNGEDYLVYEYGDPGAVKTGLASLLSSEFWLLDSGRWRLQRLGSEALGAFAARMRLS